MEPEYLRSCSKDMLDSIKEVDKDGVWLIESWAFSYSNWKDEDILCQFISSQFFFITAIEAFLSAKTSIDDMIVLDLYSDLVRCIKEY